jgi:hypothetical protein
MLELESWKGLPMKFPKYSCSVCRKPSSRKWNLVRHINNCHAGIGNCVSNWDFPEDTDGLYWNIWKKGATSQKKRSHYIGPDLPSNESNNRTPFDYQHVLAEAVLKELAKMAVSGIQPTQSRIPFPFSPMSFMQYPMGTYNPDPAANLKIFGFKGYVCEKCLTPETHYVAFPNAEGQGSIQSSHFCVLAKAAATDESIDRLGKVRILRDKIPTLLKQKVNSRTGNNNHLLALKLSSPPEEIIKLRNPVNPSNPRIVFPYSKQRFLSLEPAKEENKNKCDYLRRAIALGTTRLSDEELTDFLERMRNATFGILTDHNTDTHIDGQDLLSYFVFLHIN